MSADIRTTRAFAPATVANVGPGFDCLGFALDGVGDAVEVTAIEELEVRLEVRGDQGQLPTDPDKNCASAVAIAMLEESGADFGVDILLGKGLPLGSGLGSSGASSAAAAVAVNDLLGNKYQPEELVRFAALGEEVACGAAHLDNVAPALLGGFVLVRHAREVQAVTVPTPKWWVSVCHPHVNVPTSKARAAVPKQVTLGDMTRNVSNTAALMVALMSDDMDLFGHALMSDVVVERVRAKMIPNYDMVRREALEAGAAGVTISGAGPSVFAVTPAEGIATEVGEAMASVWGALDINSDIYVSILGGRGAYVV